MNEREARAEVCRVGASLFARGYVHGTTGNISLRLAGGYLITPTDACLGELEPDWLSLVNEDGEHVSGDRPSKTLVLHRRIYRADDGARCVIHTHSRELVAASMASPSASSDFLPPITPYFVMKVGHVPLIPYAAPGAHETADRVFDAITRRAAAGTPIRAVMLERLGPNVWHSTPQKAMATLEELEETAYLCNRTAASPLDEEKLEELRITFGASW